MGLLARGPCLLLLLVLASGAAAAFAGQPSEGDADPLYRACVEECQDTGALKEASIKHCLVVPADDGQPAADKSWYAHEPGPALTGGWVGGRPRPPKVKGPKVIIPVTDRRKQGRGVGTLQTLKGPLKCQDRPWHEPLYLQWKDWNCKSECRYHCMMERESERAGLGLRPVKYHGKWPLKRASVFQEPLSAALSALTLVVQFHGWLSFFLLLYYKLPLQPETHKTYYEYTSLWHIYGLLAMNSWFWSAIYHSCDTIWTEKLYFSSGAVFLGYSLVLAILRIANLRDEPSRVMVAAPILAFVTTHILYLNFYELDKGLNMKVCTVISIAQFLLWALWAVMTRHPSRLRIIFVAIGGVVSVFLEAYDIPPQWGYVDGRAICLALAIPLSYLWWSFAKEDAEMRTSAITKKTQ